MTDEQAVRERWPDAAAALTWSRDHGGYWSVWTAPLETVHGVRWPGDVASVRGLLGLGTSQDEAWSAARRHLVERGEIPA